MNLRPYQDDGVAALRAAYRAGKRAPLYSLPTGGGKTVLFSFVARNAAARGQRVLILVHRQELLRQSSATLRAWDVQHGIIAPRQFITGRTVQVASVQTAVRRLARMAPPDLIVIDEAHHAVAGTWRKVCAAFPQARLLGVTATPARLDGKGLGITAGGLFDDLISGPGMPELIAGGYLVRPRVFGSPHHLNLDGVHTVAGDFNRRELEEVIANDRTLVGDAVEQYRRICPDEQAIVFCASIRHACDVAYQFLAAGIRTDVIDGSMGDAQRQAVVANLAHGITRVLVSVDLVSEGFDLPAVGAAILLRPTQSEGLYLQQVGRPLRPAPGKDCAFILDHVGNVARHGLPQDARVWTLDGRQARAGGAPGVSMCRACFAMNAAGSRACAECGAPLGDGRERRREPDQVDGDLEELTAAMIEQDRIARRREVRAARTTAELQRIAAERGYRPGWVYQMERNRRGRHV